MNARLIWLHVVSDGLIALAGLSFAITLAHFARKRRDLSFHWTVLCFGLFIGAYGMTHVMEIVALWSAAYWVSGLAKAVTAAVSVPTAILLVKLVPRARALPSPEELARVKSVLQQTNIELATLSYSVSHDLRTPLRHIDGFSRILLEDHAASLPSEGRRHLERISEAAQHMGCLVEDLLSLSRVGQQPLVLERTSLRAILDQALFDIAEECKDRKVDWRIGELPVAECDPGLIRQVFASLIGNALKFTRPRAQAVIEVGVLAGASEAVVFVRDNGVGFDMKYSDKLFGVFQRLHEHQEFEGRGAGLATVRRVVLKHGGRAWAEAQPDQGATFFFSLPVKTSDRPAAGRPEPEVVQGAIA